MAHHGLSHRSRRTCYTRGTLSHPSKSSQGLTISFHTRKRRLREVRPLAPDPTASSPQSWTVKAGAGFPTLPFPIPGPRGPGALRKKMGSSRIWKIREWARPPPFMIGSRAGPPHGATHGAKPQPGPALRTALRCCHQPSPSRHWEQKGGAGSPSLCRLPGRLLGSGGGKRAPHS